MKARLTILILIFSLIGNGVLIYFIWKNQADKTPIFHPFIINYNITEESLLEEGYTYAVVDVPILYKKIDNLIIGYQFDYKCEGDSIEVMECKNTRIDVRICRIFIKELDSAKIVELINKYDADIVGPFNINKGSSVSQLYGSSFFVEHRFSKQLFKFSVGKNFSNEDFPEEGYTIDSFSHFPWSEEYIRERSWIYE